VRRAYKFRLYPNATQRRELAVMLETHRRLYNACLEQRRQAWAAEQGTVGYGDQSAWFKAERAANPYFARVNFSSAQATMRQLDRAFAAFFRRVKAGEQPGYPRFKARGRFASVTFPAWGDGIRLTGNRLRVQHVGTVRAKVHRPVEGMVKTATLTLEADRWFLVLSCDLGDLSIAPSGLPPVGIDVGIEAFLTTSSGERVANPGYLKHALPQLRRQQRSLARKRKGGANRAKARRRVARTHTRVANLRREHHHQTALHLVRRHGLIAVERLNIRGMGRNHRLARAIHDAAWGGFVDTLRHKAESAGVQIVDVDPRGTSQQCSACGRLPETPKQLSQRWHTCPCGASLHRDENAARNILARALLARTGPAGRNVDPPGSCVPREAARL
jgi:putative transposase